MRISMLILTLVVMSGRSAFAQEQTAWRGGSDGVYQAENLKRTWNEGEPVIDWVYEDLGQGHSSPVFALGHIFLSSMIDSTGYITILNNEGKEVKRYPYGVEFFESFPGARSTPVIVGDWLYMYSGKGVIYAFDAMTGTLRWEKPILEETDGENIKWGVTETLLVDGDVIYSSPGGKTNNVVALNRKTGEMIWSSPGVGDLSAYCTPLVVNMNNRKLLVTMMASHIIGLDAASGELLWNYEQPNQWSVHANTPVYADGILACTSGYGKGTVGLKLSDDGAKAEKAWFNSDFDSRMGGVVYLDGHLYGSGDKNREWRCINMKTGEARWESTEVGKGVVIAADNLLFLYSERGELALAEVSSEAFRLKGQTKVTHGSAQHWAHPVIFNNKLYLRHGNALISYIIK
ncbi:PQQ-binding-like beta-propeller repeat protein [Roseimarinus sediminis]|uniref:PQQ-binding-like beta-propeller repeat protein n=1 Tax=Roseimarinus sediminis TaxID=1610899 RepID=UPI003D24F230